MKKRDKDKKVPLQKRQESMADAPKITDKDNNRTVEKVKKGKQAGNVPYYDHYAEADGMKKSKNDKNNG